LSTQNPDPLLGQQLDSFLIQHPLGRGGMSRVYKGLDTHLKRAVAVKVIEERLRTSSTYTQRFEREAQAVANLKHPNIVTVFFFGKHENLYYLVMEYIDGADLDAIMRSYESNGELMPHADVLRILEAIASALDYAHSHGVIHRDVKPSNIMLERDGRPVLTDFGLALRVSEGTIGDAFGSPHYISPEQARNSANAVPQSDLYSLGVVAYELLAGVVPFDDPSPTALALQHIMAPVPSPRTFNHDLPEQVEPVLIKALAKTPEERYQTGAAFIAALRDGLEAAKARAFTGKPADLPPLPPGVEPLPPRRLSMQTALDKLNQVTALEQAKGQARTRSAESGEVDRDRVARGFVPYLIAGGAAVIVLAILSAIVFALIGTPQPAPTIAILPTSVPTITPFPTSTPTNLPTETPIPPTTVMPTATSAPPTATITAIPPTDTPMPPTPVPPTLSPTPEPPAIIPTAPPVIVLPTLVPQTPTPTVLYPDGLLFILIWDDGVFYVANESGQRVASSNMAFDRLLSTGGTGEHYEGRRWSAFYPWNEPRRCLVLRQPRTRFLIPSTECPDGYNSDVQTQSGEVFWTAADNSTAFRVLWKGAEVGRCEIARRRCEVHFPRS
jgi:serine/threonine protein kinase